MQEFSVNESVIVKREGLFGIDGTVGVVLRKIDDEGYIVKVDDNELYFLNQEVSPMSSYRPRPRYKPRSFREYQSDF